MPVYIIQAKSGTPVLQKRLVRANSKSQAIRFVSESMLACEVASGETVADLMRVGFPCEDARAPETAELPLSAPTIESATSTAEKGVGTFTASVSGVTSYMKGEAETAAQNLDALDGVLDQANAIDQVAIKEIDNVF